ncbi:uncharacterized protein RCC_00115 [Ramularia collo-cygni]|uniref:Major facilitator superfamily (MFS) profile domain-containing protein n=1 Tax=Ramularia collo-cygni TaxID=112498 RepID=A0A2D3UL91_9PEZI|nr:uncharacterized protein RCC_00115 [Ramularia collo-cygni]CZT14142.1 uncharacterized protein RCC_00115 [Ramularia collo-cygni]
MTHQDIFTYGLLTPTLPFALPNRAHVPAKDVQTYTSVVLALAPATIVVTAPLAGWLSDRAARRRPLFISAVIIQAIATGLFTDGRSLALWLSGAVLAGISSAVVWSSSLAMILDRIPKENIAESLGYTSLSLGLGIFLGPILGGVLWEHAGPYAAWGLCFGFLAIDLALRLLAIEEPRSREDSVRHEDEEKASVQFLPALRLLSSPRLLWGLWATIVQGIALSAFDAALVIFARNTFHWNSTAAGLLYIPFVLPSFLSPWVGQFADRHGGRLLATFGFLLATVVLTCLRFVDHNSISQKVLLCALLFLASLAMGSTLSVFSAEAAHVVFEYEEEHPGSFVARVPLHRPRVAGGLPILLGPLLDPCGEALYKELRVGKH